MEDQQVAPFVPQPVVEEVLDNLVVEVAPDCQVVVALLAVSFQQDCAKIRQLGLGMECALKKARTLKVVRNMLKKNLRGSGDSEPSTEL